MDINQFIEQKIEKIRMMVMGTTKKILNKEFKKIKRDIIKGVWKNG